MTQETKVLLGIGLITIAIIVGAAFVFGGKTTTTSNDTNTPPKKVDQKVLIKKDSHIFGTSDAKVTLVEFGDYQCPACGAAYPVTKQILNDYSGKIKFVFRNFPLSQHQNAMIAAEAAEAAGTQGKFWEMHDMLYDKQLQWGESTTPLDFFTDYAKTIGLDIAKFTKDIQTNAYQDAILNDESDGNTLGVNATPTFYINGVVTQTYTYDGLKSLIDGQLNK